MYWILPLTTDLLFPYMTTYLGLFKLYINAKNVHFNYHVGRRPLETVNSLLIIVTLVASDQVDTF